MKFALGLALSMIFAGNALAGDKWMPVMETKGGKVELLTGSVMHDSKAMYGTFQFTTADGQVIGMAELSDESCQRGKGSISIYVDMNKKPGQMDYSEGARDAGGHIGKVLCAAHDYMKKRGEI